MTFEIGQVIKAGVTLFTVIDIIGVLPLLIDIGKNDGIIHAEKASVTSLFIMLLALFLGDQFMRFLGVTQNSFAVAGGIILFILAMEMVLGRNIIKKEEKKSKASAIIPVAFPLISGAGTITTILSLKSIIGYLEMTVAIVLNILIVYMVLRYLYLIQNKISDNTLVVMRKLFGVILLAISVGMITQNLSALIIK